MKIVTIPPIIFLYFTPEPINHDRCSSLALAGQLYEEAVNWKMPITGAFQFHYRHFAGQTDPGPLIEVALPVQSFPDEYDGLFQLKRTEQYKCAMSIHLGSHADIEQTYERLRYHINANGLVLTDYNREVYVAFDAFDSSVSMTIVQIGIA